MHVNATCLPSTFQQRNAFPAKKQHCLQKHRNCIICVVTLSASEGHWTIYTVILIHFSQASRTSFHRLATRHARDASVQHWSFAHLPFDLLKHWRFERIHNTRLLNSAHDRESCKLVHLNALASMQITSQAKEAPAHVSTPLKFDLGHGITLFQACNTRCNAKKSRVSFNTSAGYCTIEP